MVIYNKYSSFIHLNKNTYKDIHTIAYCKVHTDFQVHSRVTNNGEDENT